MTVTTTGTPGLTCDLFFNIAAVGRFLLPNLGCVYVDPDGVTAG